MGGSRGNSLHANQGKPKNIRELYQVDFTGHPGLRSARGVAHRDRTVIALFRGHLASRVPLVGTTPSPDMYFSHTTPIWHVEMPS